MPNDSTITPETTELKDKNLLHLSLIIIFGIFATTLPQPQVLGKLSLQHILKGELHVSRGDMSSFFLICGLFWYLKPIAGVLTDSFPLFGTRRRWYLLISSVLAFLSWIVLAFLPHTYNALLLGCIVVNLFMVMASTVTGAFLVETGKSLGSVGKLTSVRQVVFGACTLLNGPLSGFLASGLFMYAAGINGFLILSIFPVAFVLLREQPHQVNRQSAVQNMNLQLKAVMNSKPLWWALLFIGLFYFSPGFSTPLYYIQKDQLKLSDQQIGNLGVFSGAASIAAALVYGHFIRRLNLSRLLVGSIITAAAGTLFYLFYKSYGMAVMIESQNGFFFGLAEVALIDLAARATPVGAEGLGYSLILSIRNLALFSADKVGSNLADAKWDFSWLVFLNAGTTIVVLVLLPFLPKVLLASRDTGKQEPELAAA